MRGIYCKNCARIIQYDANYCETCGQLIESNEGKNKISFSYNNGKSKKLNLIVSIILGLILIMIGASAGNAFYNEIGLTDVLIFFILIFLFQLLLFYLQKKNKSYYPLIPIVISFSMIHDYRNEIESLSNANAEYGISFIQYNITFMHYTIYFFSIMIAINLICLFVKSKSFRQTRKNKITRIY